MKSKSFLFLLALLMISFFMAPYIPLWSLWTSFEMPKQSLKDIYLASTQQALCSVLLTAVLGGFCASGLLWMRRHVPARWMSVVEYMNLLPSLLPSLFVIISTLSVVPQFPFGFWGVVILHALTMMGFTGVLLVRLLDDKLGQHSVVAAALGARGCFFFRKMFPIISRDLFLLLSVLFFYFLTSISIPLIIGGTALTSVEKVIYDQVAIQHNWNTALQYFALQAMMLIPIFVFAQTYKTKGSVQTQKLRLGSSAFGFAIALVPSCILLMGLFLRLFPGLHALLLYPEFYRSLPVVIVGSLLLGFLAGGFSALLLVMWTVLSLHIMGQRLLRLLCVPSITIVAFGFSLWSIDGIFGFFYSAFALALIFVPVLFRLGVYQNLVLLQTQIDSARQMGADTVFLFHRVVLPQIAHHIFLLSG
ncbi:MAG: hypothetical protein IT287_05995, partial [Bdellovibrionaceae bacterium]|nr:hypothetical protein [Pseudobdellovibrionaceae bacterium]